MNARARARIDVKPGSIYPQGEVTVWTVWEGVDVDRPDGHGYLIGPASSKATHKLAERMAAAIDAQAVFYDLEILTDVGGKTFVSARSRVLGRIMNADLRRLGF